MVNHQSSPPNCRPCLSAIRRRGHESRHRGQDSPRVRRQLQVNQRGPGIATIMLKFPVQSPMGVIGYFPMAFTHRLPQLDVENGLVFDTQSFATYNCTQRNRGGVW